MFWCWMNWSRGQMPTWWASWQSDGNSQHHHVPLLLSFLESWMKSHLPDPGWSVHLLPVLYLEVWHHWVRTRFWVKPYSGNPTVTPKLVASTCLMVLTFVSAQLSCLGPNSSSPGTLSWVLAQGLETKPFPTSLSSWGWIQLTVACLLTGVSADTGCGFEMGLMLWGRPKLDDPHQVFCFLDTVPSQPTYLLETSLFASFVCQASTYLSSAPHLHLVVPSLSRHKALLCLNVLSLLDWTTHGAFLTWDSLSLWRL